jgi:diguanylate cyclase (GGDEF)-like protein/PAS domain S-box-containing protein
VELTVSVFSHAGYDISAHRLETADAMQAALDSEPWDAIISDFKMPQFSAEKSLEVYNNSGLDIPFIIVSGVVEVEDVVFLLKKGAHDFLNKHALNRLIPALERELRDSSLRQAKRQADQKISILSLAVEQSPVSVVIISPTGLIEYVNPKFELSTGYSSEEAIGRHFGFTVLYEKTLKEESSQEQDMSEDERRHALVEALWSSIKQSGHWSGELCQLDKGGSLYWECVTVSPLEDDDGTVSRFVAVQEDITVRRSYEDKLRKQAHYDDLTGLANRRLMMEKLNDAVDYSREHAISTALLCIDLDHFKNINDTLGHEIGDKLLVKAAARLAVCTKRSDILARIGGDEFAIVLPRIEENLLIQRVADRIMTVFARPFLIDEQEHFITASIGVAKYPEDSTEPQVLLKNADLAMYQAKAMGRNQCQFFSEEINTKLKTRVAIEGALRGVELRDELELHYQPIVDAKTNTIVLCEALLRWRNSDGQLIMPDTFISIAEETGLIHKVGEWVVKKACKDLQYIHQHINPNLKFAINISPNQLLSAGFSSFVRKQLEDCHIQSSMIELEITESVLLHDLGETNKNLTVLSDAGFHLSIDDFGTGYSSLAYLHKYPFSTLKIDRSFVSHIEDNNKNAKLTEAMINMAHSLGMQVVAEGVETQEQLAFLRERQCELIQGYLFSKPIPLDALMKKLKSPNSTVVEFPR